MDACSDGAPSAPSVQLEFQAASLVQLQGCVSILYGSSPMHQQLLALAARRPCHVARLLNDDVPDLALDLALDQLRQAERDAQRDGVELALLLDTPLASAAAQRLAWVPCGALHAWCWAPLWRALDADLSFGSAEALPWIELSTGRLTHSYVSFLPDACAPCAPLPSLYPPLQITNGAPEPPEPSEPSSTPALALTSIYLPDNLQRRGLGTQILERLAARAQREGRRFVVGPIMEEAMRCLVDKLGYRPCAPFSAYKAE